MDNDADERAVYTADMITVRTLEEVVRARPGMYFGYTREDPALMTAVARAAVLDAFVLPTASFDVTVMIESDHRFIVSDNLPISAITVAGDLPTGHDERLIPRRRWYANAVAAVCTHTRVEVRTAGRLWVQELSGGTPTTPPHDDGPTEGEGIRVSYELDPDYFAPGAALPRDTAALRVDDDGNPLAEPGISLSITDLRQPRISDAPTSP